MHTTQAQKNYDVSSNKLRILKMSLENRLEEFPALVRPSQELNGDHGGRPVLPRPAQLTGTFYLKLLGVEGLLDLYTLRQITSEESGNSPPRSYSASQVRDHSTGHYSLPNWTCHHIILYNIALQFVMASCHLLHELL